jgi:hypothetical protein
MKKICTKISFGKMVSNFVHKSLIIVVAFMLNLSAITTSVLTVSSTSTSVITIGVASAAVFATLATTNVEAQTIYIGTVASSFNPGDSVYVPCSTSTGFLSGNNFIAQLSDASGGFGSPVNIGVVAGTSASSIPSQIPCSTYPPSTSYRIRIIGTNPSGITSLVSNQFAINNQLSASNAIQTNVTCNGGNNGYISTNINYGTTPYTYLWNTSPPQTTSYADNLIAGIYNVTVTDHNGCTAVTPAAIITQPSPIVLTLTDTVIYSIGIAAVTATGGISPYTYLWSPTGATTQTIISSEFGGNSVVVTDAHGCTAMISQAINLPDTEGVSPSFCFYQNYGQIKDTRDSVSTAVKFYTMGGNYFLQDTISYAFLKKDSTSSHHDTSARVDLSFQKGNTSNPIAIEQLFGGVQNFYLPQCPTGITDVHPYQYLLYPEIYNHVEALFTGTNAGLKYYIMIMPGADTSQIKLQYSGVDIDSTVILVDGSMRTYCKFGGIKQLPPEVYQVDSSGDRVALTWGANYYVSGTNELGFNLGAYNTNLPLIIQIDRNFPSLNPVTIGNLKWSTYDYLDDDSGEETNNLDVTTDTAGNSYTVGRTYYGTIPLTNNAFQANNNGTVDGFYMQFNSGDTLLVCTYIGSSDSTEVHGVVFNPIDTALYITGYTKSTGLPILPLTNPSNGSYYKDTNSGGKDAIIARIGKTTGRPTWIALIGGDGDDDGRSITCDLAGNIFVTGNTRSTQLQANGCLATIGNNFPLCDPGLGAYFQNFNAGGGDIFVIKFDTANKLKWSTLVGSDKEDSVYEIGFIRTADVVALYICGMTTKTDDTSAMNHSIITSASGGHFPLISTGSSYSQVATNTSHSNAFLCKFSIGGVLQWSTNFNNVNSFQTVTTSSVTNSMYAVGITDVTGTSVSNCNPISTDHVPVYNPISGFSHTASDGGNLYVVRFDVNEDTLDWATLYPGFMDIVHGTDFGFGISVTAYDKFIDATCDDNGDLFITSTTLQHFQTQSSTPSGMYQQEENNTAPDSEFGFQGLNPDACVIGFGSDDNLFWASLFGSPGLNSPNDNNSMFSDISSAIAVYKTNKLYITGYSATLGYDNYWGVNFPFRSPGGSSWFVDGPVSDTGNYDYMYGYIACFDLYAVGLGGIPNLSNQKYDGVLIFPNPTNTAINIKLSILSANETMIVTDVFGRIICHKTLEGINTRLDVSNWNNGIYFYEITNGKDIMRGKFIK